MVLGAFLLDQFIDKRENILKNFLPALFRFSWNTREIAPLPILVHHDAFKVGPPQINANRKLFHHLPFYTLSLMMYSSLYPAAGYAPGDADV